MIRQRNRTKEALKKFEKLDAFQKVKDEYEETSIIGGTRKQFNRKSKRFIFNSNLLQFQ